VEPLYSNGFWPSALLLYNAVMPELPEVETIARRLNETLPGRTIARAALSAPDLYRKGSRRVTWIRGARVRNVVRFGKAILFRFDGPRGDDRVVAVSLGMTGRFCFFAPGEKLPRGVVHRHGRWAFTDGAELHYVDPRRFGYFYLGSIDGLGESLNIGPDPFALRPRAFERILEGRTAPVKSLLLNQRLVSGLGNIYVDESLFLAGIHPLTPGGVAARHAREILSTARRVLRRAIRNGGTTFRDYRGPDGAEGSFQTRLSVYGREGEACPRCGAAIERLVIGGRGTHICPSCQRLRTR
jgi:formamidopyrimidine-DNA glycosylase